MNKLPLIVKILVSPIALLYWIGVSIRNRMFDLGILNSQKFENVTVISIGNITMGGTGKTPFTEYLVRTLKDNANVAILSRGYKRKTKGFVLATNESTAREIGDEPYQMKQKFPDVAVAVDAKRKRGIDRMMEELSPKPDVFILDDAFQHRYVNPDLAVLLIDYNALITKDHIFPIGMLREPLSAKDRANIVVVTKCPPTIKPIDMRILGKEMNLYPYQNLYFTTISYDEMVKLFKNGDELKHDEIKDYTALVISGIAKPELFEDYVKGLTKDTEIMRFSDHHEFSKRNYKKIKETFDGIGNSKKIIITTEKDAVRMKCDDIFPEELKPFIYYIPLKTTFVNDEDKFNTSIRKHIDANKPHMRLSEN